MELVVSEIMAEETEPRIKIIIPVIGPIITILLWLAIPKSQIPALASAIGTVLVYMIFLSNRVQRNERPIMSTI